MQKFKNITLSLTVFALALGLGGTVFAHTGQEDGSDSGTTASQGQRGSGSATFATQTRSIASESETEKPRTPTELRQQAADEIAERKKNAKAKSQEQRKKACEQRKKGLETKFSSISTNTQRIQSKIDKILERAIAYADKHELNSGEIADLVTAANEAKSKSAASVENLQTVKPTTIDCTTNTVPGDVATFKVATKEARDNLKVYRMAAKDLLKVLIDAGKTSNPTGSADHSNENSQEGAN